MNWCRISFISSMDVKYCHRSRREILSIYEEASPVFGHCHLSLCLHLQWGYRTIGFSKPWLFERFKLSEHSLSIHSPWVHMGTWWLGVLTMVTVVSCFVSLFEGLANQLIENQGHQVIMFVSTYFLTHEPTTLPARGHDSMGKICSFCQNGTTRKRIFQVTRGKKCGAWRKLRRWWTKSIGTGGMV